MNTIKIKFGNEVQDVTIPTGSSVEEVLNVVQQGLVERGDIDAQAKHTLQNGVYSFTTPHGDAGIK